MSYQPKTGAKCGCRRGIERDNCPQCEGTGWVIDFVAIRARAQSGCSVVACDQAAADATDNAVDGKEVQS